MMNTRRGQADKMERWEELRVGEDGIKRSSSTKYHEVGGQSS